MPYDTRYTVDLDLYLKGGLAVVVGAGAEGSKKKFTFDARV